MKKNMINVIFMGFTLFFSHASSAFTPTTDDLKQGAVVILVQGWAYFYHQQQLQTMDNNIDFCIANNAHIYTPETRQFIQQCVESCGVTATVTAISGLIYGGNEGISFAVMEGKDNVFYLNIPFSWINFLNDMLKKMNNNEILTEAESTKLNSLSFLISHEMNHVKKMLAGTSVASRTYPLKKSLAILAGIVGLGIYIAHEYKVSYLQQLPLNLLLVCGQMAYFSKKHCTEEYACDSEGIDNTEYLRAGKEWFLTDCKNYVDEFFTKKSAFIQEWYQKYPNAFCSFFTSHPHPVARAERLDEKIAALEKKNTATHNIA
jgi:hypothetical protein